MADAAMPANAAAPGESPAQLKARLRRERLATKSSGAARLQQITALQGGPPRTLSEVEKDVPVKPSTPSQFTPAASATATPDPEEEDISQHHYTPASQPRLPSPFALEGNAGGPFGAAPGSDPSQDPMIAMLQQMMGAGAGGMPSAQPGAAPGNLPPGLANMFSAVQGGAGPAEPSPEKTSAWMWHLVHSIFSLGLAIYIVLQTPFTGSKLARDSVLEDDGWTVESDSTHSFANFFYLFATFEVVMQSSRYFIEKGQLQGSGILNTVAGILPTPYSGYIKTIGRYSVIYSTIMSDSMVVVFVLGASSWWRGAVVA